MFALTIRTDNEAFQDGNGPAEIARILQRVAADVGYGEKRGSLYDLNGNRVGAFTFDNK